MNDIEFMIGEMLNDEKRRVIYIPLVDLTKIVDPDILIIAQELISDKEFSFFDFYKKYGKEVAVKAMDLANRAAKIKLTNEGKL